MEGKQKMSSETVSLQGEQEMEKIEYLAWMWGCEAKRDAPVHLSVQLDILPQRGVIVDDHISSRSTGGCTCSAGHESIRLVKIKP